MLRQTGFIPLALIVAGLVSLGCAQLATRPAGLFARKSKPPEEGPPAAAPALYIPGPVATVPPAAPPATPPSAISLVPETLPLSAPPSAGQSKNNGIVQTGGQAQGTPPTPGGANTPDSSIAPLRELHEKAAKKFASMDSFTVRLRRREVVGNQNRPEEILLFKWRREPWSVYFKWLGNEGKGREVVYVKGRYDNALHTLTAAGDIPLLPAGKRFKVSPDSVLVKAKSRYPITDAGFGSMIDRYGKLVEALEKGDTREGTAKYLGQLKRPEFENKIEAVLQVIPPKSDPHLPRGGQRLWFFDVALHLPTLLITQDDTGREVEYYCYDRLLFPVNLTDEDFNPDVLWKNMATK